MSEPARGAAGIQILIVDDDPDIRDVLQMTLDMLLAEHPHQVLTAGNGKEALEAIRGTRPDLVLLDLMMPIMNGAEFLDAVRRDERLRRMPVIIVSAWRSATTNIQGAQGFLGKPIDVDDVMTIVEKYCL
jgi:CheY-like chemotaxis protein